MRFHMGLRAPRALVASLALGSTGMAVNISPSGAAAASTPTTPAGSSEQLTALPAGTTPLPAGFTLAPVAPVRTSFRIRRIRLNVLGGQAASIAGALRSTLKGRPGVPGESVALEALTRRGWRAVSHTLTRTGGRFVLRYRAHYTRSERVRVRFAGDRTHLGARRFLGDLNVYRLAGASWYGGGGTMACGGYLTSSTMGVANKTLPCGTLVTLHYNGRTVRVPVVDRGPYVAGRDFDLTEATKRALDFEGVAEVWSTR